MLQQAAEWPPVAFMVDILVVLVVVNGLEIGVCDGARGVI